MSRHKKRTAGNTRDAPAQQKRSVMMCNADMWTVLCGDGYRPLLSCPEVQMCINVYADAIANMTIHLMQNTGTGDKRIKDQLSRRLDIAPNRLMTHQTYMSNIVRVLMGKGEGNMVVVPTYNADGMLEELIPVPPSRLTIIDDPTDGYYVRVGHREFEPEEVLHFVINPDEERPWVGTGFRAQLRDVVKSIRQAGATKNALLENPAPSVIVKVDGYNQELQTPEGRDKLADQYLTTSKAGKPLVLQADSFEVQQVKPLTINDLAIKENLELDKRSVAAIMGVPAFLVGVGEFRAEEYDWFISTRVMAIAREIEQEMTRKLLYAPDRYLRLNNRSLLNYNLQRVVEMSCKLLEHLVVSRNEVRDWIGMTPREDMEELLALENYIPVAQLGQQKKLKGGEDNAE